MPTRTSPHLDAARLLPKGLFLMTAAHEGKRAGALVETVQVCGESPALLCVTMRSGHWIEPIIRDSHTFGICLLDPADRLTLRKFVEPGQPREPGDPFDCMPVEKLTTGAPVIRRAIAAFDCEVARHLDIDSEFSLYVATIMASRVYRTHAPSAPIPLPMERSDRPPSRPSMTG